MCGEDVTPEDMLGFVAGVVTVYTYGDVDVIAFHFVILGKEEIRVYVGGRKIREKFVMMMGGMWEEMRERYGEVPVVSPEQCGRWEGR